MTKEEVKKRLEALPDVLRVDVEDVVHVHVVIGNQRSRDSVYREEIEILDENKGLIKYDFSCEILGWEYEVLDEE